MATERRVQERRVTCDHGGKQCPRIYAMPERETETWGQFWAALVVMAFCVFAVIAFVIALEGWVR